MTELPSSPTPAPDPSVRHRRSLLFRLWQGFWLLFLVVSLGYAWYCFYVPANTIAWVRDFPTAQQQAAQSGKPLLLFFTGTWCVPCRIMKRNVWADEQVASSVNARFVPVMLDRDDPETGAAWQQYQVGVTPTTIIAEPSGKVLHQVSRGMGREEFLDLMAKVQP